MSDQQSIPAMAKQLAAYACGYKAALFSHCRRSEQSAEVDYLFAQACFVASHPKTIAKFLRFQGVAKIETKHLQYFFAICPPLWAPYQELWRFVELRVGTVRPESIRFDAPRNTRSLV